MKLLPQLRAWIHARTAPRPEPIEADAPIALPPAYVTALQGQVAAAAAQPKHCSVCGEVTDSPFWLESPRLRLTTRPGEPDSVKLPYCFFHWPGRHGV